LDGIYIILYDFITNHYWLSVYLAGCIMSFGIVYSLLSYTLDKPKNIVRFYIVCILASWITISTFVYGFLKGFIQSFKNNKLGD
jgi:hypothetical protein